jgi:hypothetical protein
MEFLGGRSVELPEIVLLVLAVVSNPLLAHNTLIIAVAVVSIGLRVFEYNIGFVCILPFSKS